MRIFKYELKFNEVTELHMAVTAKVLSAGFQGDKVVIWATMEPDPMQKTKVRKFAVAPTGIDTAELTGASFHDDRMGRNFIATICNPDLSNTFLPHGIVAHIWEV
jgi:hypothetical protein